MKRHKHDSSETGTATPCDTHDNDKENSCSQSNEIEDGVIVGISSTNEMQEDDGGKISSQTQDIENFVSIGLEDVGRRVVIVEGSIVVAWGILKNMYHLACTISIEERCVYVCDVLPPMSGNDDGIDITIMKKHVKILHSTAWPLEYPPGSKMKVLNMSQFHCGEQSGGSSACMGIASEIAQRFLVTGSFDFRSFEDISQLVPVYCNGKQKVWHPCQWSRQSKK